jgi:hypothetical protein
MSAGGSLLVAKQLENFPRVKQHILAHGSVITALCIFPDFKDYYVTNTSGVYDIPTSQAFQYVANNQVLGHAIACTGWDDVNRFWICRNSWGPSWADGGYFRVSRVAHKSSAVCGCDVCFLINM